MKKDEYVRVLDYLPKGKSDVPPHKRKPIAQAIGEKYFSLLEISPRSGMSFDIEERVYIGDDTRDKVDHIERRIKYEWLTPTAKSELLAALEKIIIENEEQFVNFYNTVGTISTRQHKLECLPKIGKRHREDILRERSIKLFTSFEDIKSRVKNIPNPVRILTEKIVEELEGKSKYYLFVPVLAEKEST